MEGQINKALGNIFNEKNREIKTFGGYYVSYSCVYYPSIILLNTWNLKIGEYHLDIPSYNFGKLSQLLRLRAAFHTSSLFLFTHVKPVKVQLCPYTR